MSLSKFTAAILSLFITVDQVVAEEVSRYRTSSAFELEEKVRELLFNGQLKRTPSPISSDVELRDFSISDIEISDLKSDFKEYYKKEVDERLISIGAVTVGCECEPEECTNQVFLTYQNNHILFSKISKKWKVSSLHKWWEDYHSLYDSLANAKNDNDEIGIQNKINTLMLSAPQCNESKKSKRGRGVK